MDDVFVYTVDLPDNINEMITPCADGYTVYIDRRLTREAMLDKFRHALSHIYNRDFEKTNVQAIESEAHR